MGSYSLNLKYPNTSSTLCNYQLSLPLTTSSLLAKMCQDRGTAGGIPTLSIKEMPKEFNQQVTKLFSKQSGLLSPLIPSGLLDKAAEMTKNMKPSAQSGFGFEILNDRDFNKAYQNSVQYDPANSEALLFYIDPIGQSAGFSFKINRKEIEAEFGIHIHAPSDQ